jgi:hypothetical protein
MLLLAADLLSPEMQSTNVTHATSKAVMQSAYQANGVCRGEQECMEVFGMHAWLEIEGEISIDRVAETNARKTHRHQAQYLIGREVSYRCFGALTHQATYTTPYLQGAKVKEVQVYSVPGPVPN